MVLTLLGVYSIIAFYPCHAQALQNLTVRHEESKTRRITSSKLFLLSYFLSDYYFFAQIPVIQGIQNLFCFRMRFIFRPYS